MSIELPQGITEETVGELVAWTVQTPVATGQVFAQGAQVTRWAPAGSAEVLWLSKESLFQRGKAIRGGVPICFPWFGPGRDGNHKPAHGFARSVDWELVRAEVAEGVATLVFELRGDQVADLGDFPADFTARHTITMGTELAMELTVEAHGTPLDFEEALHTYFSVSDSRTARVIGLDGVEYADKVDGGALKTQQGDVEFISETDRIYHTAGSTELVDEKGNRVIEVGKTNSADTVVWNPWVEKAAGMGDFGDQEWTGMCCIEAVNCLAHAVFLAPGQQHAMAATIRVR